MAERRISAASGKDKGVTDRCDLPDGYDVNTYELFQGTPAKVLHGGESIDIGGRRIEVLHTPGHSPGHMCFWEKEKGYLYTGDLVYQDMVYYPKFAVDCFALLKEIVGSYLEQTEVLEQ